MEVPRNKNCSTGDRLTMFSSSDVKPGHYKNKLFIQVFFFRVNDLSCLYLNNSKQGEKISQFATKSTEKILEDSFSSFTVVTN